MWKLQLHFPATLSNPLRLAFRAHFATLIAPPAVDDALSRRITDIIVEAANLTQQQFPVSTFAQVHEQARQLCLINFTLEEESSLIDLGLRIIGPLCLMCPGLAAVLQWCLGPVDQCWNWAIELISRVLTCPNSQRRRPLVPSSSSSSSASDSDSDDDDDPWVEQARRVPGKFSSEEVRHAKTVPPPPPPRPPPIPPPPSSVGSEASTTESLTTESSDVAAFTAAGAALFPNAPAGLVAIGAEASASVVAANVRLRNWRALPSSERLAALPQVQAAVESANRQASAAEARAAAYSTSVAAGVAALREAYSSDSAIGPSASREELLAWACRTAAMWIWGVGAFHLIPLEVANSFMAGIASQTVHALRCVIPFLPIAAEHRSPNGPTDVSALVRVSRSWRAAVNGAGSSLPLESGRLPARISIDDSGLFARPSSLACLVTDLRQDISFMSYESMTHFKWILPNLRVLRARLLKPGPLACAFPLHLVNLSLTNDLVDRPTNLLETIGAMQQLERFQLRMGNHSISHLNFQLLHPAPKLTHFVLDGGQHATDQQLADLRTLPHQVTLPCDISHNLAARLLQPLSPSRWTSLAVEGVVVADPEICDLLRTFASLTELNVAFGPRAERRHQSFLAPLVNLTDLRLTEDQSPTAILPTLLLPSLQGMRGLTRLELVCCSLDSNDMAQLLPLLPRLMKLTLDHCYRITSLHFLAAPAGASSSFLGTLTHLQLLDCPIEQDPHHLRGLRSLTRLIVRYETNPTANQLVGWRELGLFVELRLIDEDGRTFAAIPLPK